MSHVVFGHVDSDPFPSSPSTARWRGTLIAEFDFPGAPSECQSKIPCEMTKGEQGSRGCPRTVSRDPMLQNVGAVYS